MIRSDLKFLMKIYWPIITVIVILYLAALMITITEKPVNHPIETYISNPPGLDGQKQIDQPSHQASTTQDIISPEKMQQLKEYFNPVEVKNVPETAKDPTSQPKQEQAINKPADAPLPAPVQQTTPPAQAIIINQPAPEYIPPTPTPVQEPIIQSPEPIKSMSKIEIISPMANKGLGRTYLANTEIKDESNYIELGLVVYDDSGEVVRDVEVNVKATDSDQNKSMTAAGNIAKIYVDGAKRSVYYYPFSYQFKTSGDHIIIFSALGLTKEVTLNASEDTREN